VLKVNVCECCASFVSENAFYNRWIEKMLTDFLLTKIADERRFAYFLLTGECSSTKVLTSVLTGSGLMSCVVLNVCYIFQGKSEFNFVFLDEKV